MNAKQSATVIYKALPNEAFYRTYVNKGVIDLVGYTPHELNEQPSKWTENIHPEDKAVLNEPQGLFAHKHLVLKYRFKHKNGHYIKLVDELNLIPGEAGNPGEIMGVIYSAGNQAGNNPDPYDVPEFQPEQRNNRDKFQSYIDIADVMLLALDKTGKVTLINKKGSSFLGYEPEDVIGLDWFGNFVSANEREKLRSIFKKVMNEEHNISKRITATLLSRKGTPVVIRFSNTILRDEDGKARELISSGENVTQSLAMEDALRKSENRFRKITERSHSLIAEIDQNLEFVYANSMHQKLLGYSPYNLIGTKCYDISHREDRTKFKLKLEEVIDTGESIDAYVMKVVARNGEIFKMEVTASLIETSKGDRNVAIIADNITEHLRIQEELERTASLYKMLASNIPDIGIFIYDENLRFILAEGNELIVDASDNKTFIGNTIQEVFPERIHKILSPVFQLALRGTSASRDFTDGKRHYIIQVLPLEQNHRKTGMAIIQNITEVKLHEASLKNAKEEAEKANSAKNDFIANMSHEIRTPLNAIVGFSEQLEKTKLDQKQAAFLKTIQDSSEHLLSLVNEVLMVSKIEAGEITFENIPFKLNNVLEGVKSVLSYRASEKGIGFNVTELKGKENYVLKGDPFRLRQVLINLMSNAIKFTIKGKVLLESNLKVDSKNHVITRFKVIDTGIGIPTKRLHTIFDQFRQVDSSITRKYGGTGLGLTISKNLIEMQGGDIEVESEEDAGSTFTVTIPYKKAAKSELIEEQETGEVDPEVLKGKKILLVDDDTTNLQLGELLLQNMGVDAELASSGQEAIEKAEDQEFDVILLDIHMPEVSGYEVAAHIRAGNGKEHRQPKIVAVTAMAVKDEIKRYKEAGIDDYLIKPFKEINLYNKICHVLGLRKNHKSSAKTYKTKPKEKPEVTKQEPDNELYDLSELKKFTKDNNSFLLSMIDNFIRNASESTQKLRENTEKQDWKQVGEVAHKMLSSYRHLKINRVLKDLAEIEDKALRKGEYEGLPSKVNMVIEYTQKVIESLEDEKKKINNQ